MGSSDDWCRRTTWTESDRSEFEKRLARARPHGRAQSLRIQAWTLVSTGEAELIKAGLALAERFLVQYPEDVLRGWVHHRYQHHAIRAVIAAAKGYASQAREEAALALEIAAATHSGVSRHPTVGLVDPSDELIPRLRTIAF